MEARATPCVLCFLFVAFATLCGCGPQTATVKGTVTYKGAPVDYGSVVFFIDDKDAIPAQLGPEGVFTAKGVPYGDAKVAVFSRRAGERPPPKHTHSTKEGPMPETKGVVIPEEYNDKETSDLTLRIDRPIIDDFKIELKDPD